MTRKDTRHRFFSSAPTDTRSALQIRRDVIARERTEQNLQYSRALAQADRDRLRAVNAELLAALGQSQTALAFELENAQKRDDPIAHTQITRAMLRNRAALAKSTKPRGKKHET